MKVQSSPRRLTRTVTPFVGNITATGGRITGDMQVDATADVGGNGRAQCTSGKLTNEDGQPTPGRSLSRQRTCRGSRHHRNDARATCRLGQTGHHPTALSIGRNRNG